MTKQITVAFCTEGPTDNRFLESIIQRTFEEVAFECTGQVDILPVELLDKKTGPFVELIQSYAKIAAELGIMILCVHADADGATDSICFTNKINPAFDNIADLEDNSICKKLVAIVPVYMTEAWMLAEKELLKREIGTSKTDFELGIHGTPESLSNPKQKIENAIQIAVEKLTKRKRKKLKIGQLYLPLGQKIKLTSLEKLDSYNKFKASVRKAFIDLNYLQP